MKLIKILESLLPEIGDLSAGTFPFKSKASAIRTAIKNKQETLVKYAIRARSSTALNSKTSYTVVGGSGITYNISIDYQVTYRYKEKDFVSWARVDFDVKGAEEENADTNAREQYKLISTVVAVFLDFANAVEPIAPLRSGTIYAKADDSQEHSLDSKRARLYKMYIEKNLSKLPGEWSLGITTDYGQGYKLTRKKEKPKQGLKEIGDAEGKKPYTISPRKANKYNEDQIEYKFQSDNGAKYIAYVFKNVWNEEYGDSSSPLLANYDVSFGKVSKGGEANFDVSNKDKRHKFGDIFRVMATMIEIVNQEIEHDLSNGIRPMIITISPSKRKDKYGAKDMSDMRRANLYLAYVKEHMPPGSTVEMDKDGQEIAIELPENLKVKRK
jgi:hypothetical protein